MNSVVYLIGQKFSFDEEGNHISEDVEKKVFAEVQSVYGNEFFEARQNGLKTEFKLIVWSAEYSGEKLVKYNGKIYDVYRTYVKYDFTEIYLSEKVGV